VPLARPPFATVPLAIEPLTVCAEAAATNPESIIIPIEKRYLIELIIIFEVLMN
jgi:hypothetical protein